MIQQIDLTITCSGAGSGRDTKVLSFRKANYQLLQKGIKGSEQVGDALGMTAAEVVNMETAALQKLRQQEK